MGGLGDNNEDFEMSNVAKLNNLCVIKRLRSDISLVLKS